MNHVRQIFERNGLRGRLSLATTLALLALGLCWTMAPVTAGESAPRRPKDGAAPAAPPAAAQPAAPAAAKGQIVYLDENGNRVTPPPGVAKAAAPSLNRSSQGLVQVQSSVPGGGVIVDLQGRFRSYVIATKNPDGTISMTCTQGSGDPHASCAEDHPKLEKTAAPVEMPESAKTETATAKQDGKE